MQTSAAVRLDVRVLCGIIGRSNPRHRAGFTLAQQRPPACLAIGAMRLAVLARRPVCSTRQALFLHLLADLDTRQLVLQA